MYQNKEYHNPIANSFLPTTRAEMDKLGWKQCDVIFVEKDIHKKEKQKAIVQAEMKKGFKSGFAS